MGFFEKRSSLDPLRQLLSTYLGLKTVPAVLYDTTSGLIESDKFWFKEIWRYAPWTINIGTSKRNMATSIGWTPSVMMNSFEVHGILAHGYEDALNLKWSPKIGIGVSAKF